MDNSADAEPISAYLKANRDESYAAVARLFGVSRQWVHMIASRLGLKSRANPEGEPSCGDPGRCRIPPVQQGPDSRHGLPRRCRACAMAERRKPPLVVTCDYCGATLMLEGRRRAAYIYEHRLGKSKSTMCPACYTTLGPLAVTRRARMARTPQARVQPEAATTQHSPAATAGPYPRPVPDFLLPVVRRWIMDEDLSPTDVAILFRVSNRTVVGWCENGLLPATLTEIGGQTCWIIRRGALDGSPIIAVGVSDTATPPPPSASS